MSAAVGVRRGPSRGSVFGYVLGAIPVGLLALGVTLAVRTFAAAHGVVAKLDPFGPLNLPATISRGDWVNYFLPGAVLLTPIAETLIFLGVLKAFGRGKTLGGAWLFVLSMIAVGWFYHRANLLSLGQALGFGVLAVWCWQVARRFGDGMGYWLTALAHAVWNGSVYLMWLYEH